MKETSISDYSFPSVEEIHNFEREARRFRAQYFKAMIRRGVEAFRTRLQADEFDGDPSLR